MKVRIKFSKEGPAVYVGHLDTMRYFQKAIRRADLSPSFTQGYSPHMIMSFAAPLGVGVESLGEYFDVELGRDDFTERDIVERLDREMAEGFHVLGAVRVEGGKNKNAMSLVAACDYLVTLKEDLPFSLEEGMRELLSRKEILITKEGKAGLREVDIRRWIYEARVPGPEGTALGDQGGIGPGSRGEERETAEGKAVFLRLAAASSNYTKAEQVMEALARLKGLEEIPCRVKRLEVYAQREEGDFVSLLDLGEKL